MKILRSIKYVFCILLTIIVIFINCLEKHLLKENIEFINSIVILKIVLTWFVLPVTLIVLFMSLMNRNLKEKKAAVASHLSSGFLLFFVVIFFMARIGFFWLFEDRKETPLEDNLILVECDNLAGQQIYYYESVNWYSYKQVKRIV